MPHNFLHLGLISMIFPNATIIHLERDARDVALSNYFTNFRHKRTGMAYSCDLEHTGRMIKDHDRLMEHWEKVLPLQIFNLSYEDFVENQEQISRQLIDFIGGDWDDNMLEFHKTKRPVKTASAMQVRKPIYTSSKQRWRRYEEFIAPLYEGLGQ